MSHSRRVFIDTDLTQLVPGQSVEASDSDSHHLKNVLRVEPGTPITLVHRPSGTEFGACVTEVSPKVSFKVLNKVTIVRPSNPVHSLTFSLCKNPANDFVCEKAAELGLRELIFWQASRSVVRVSKEEAERKLGRWRKISESAAKQSGKNEIMEVSLALDMESLLERLAGTTPALRRRFCCSLSPGTQEIRNLLLPLAPAHLLIGPAGDLSPSEEAELIKHSFELITLGPNLLRAETAAIAAIAMVQAVAGFS